MLAACSSSGSSSSSGGGSSDSGRARGRVQRRRDQRGQPLDAKGGTLTFDSSSPPDSFDPGNTYYAWVLNLAHL